jgi:hypothetical protein
VTLRALRMVLLVPVVSILVGCGKSGPARIDVKGTVTFLGKPVPAGQILFDPDAKRSNEGPAGFARIKNGQFDTRDAGKAPIAGAHVARIIGMDGVPGPEMPRGHILFREWSKEIDVDRSNPEFDFQVPADYGVQNKKP